MCYLLYNTTSKQKFNLNNGKEDSQMSRETNMNIFKYAVKSLTDQMVMGSDITVEDRGHAIDLMVKYKIATKITRFAKREFDSVVNGESVYTREEYNIAKVTVYLEYFSGKRKSPHILFTDITNTKGN